MSEEPESRCIKMGIAPAPGVWDYRITSHNLYGQRVSVTVFQWIETKNGDGVIPDTAVKRYAGKSEFSGQLCQKA